MLSSDVLSTLSHGHDKAFDRLVTQKLKQLFDAEAKKLMDERSALLNSSSPAKDCKSRRELQREKTYALEHRLELLMRAQDDESLQGCHEHAHNVARYGEQRLMNQIDANIKAMIDTVPSLSSQILSRRVDVHEAFDGPKVLQDMADVNFGTIQQYYRNCQDKLNAKYSQQEKTFLQYELDCLERQYTAMEDIAKHEAANTATSSAAQQSHKRCDELYRRFCDRSLELLYSNSTVSQDYDWRMQEAKDASNKWRRAVSDEMEEGLRGALKDVEDSYMSIVERLSDELARLRQTRQEVALELLRIQNLAKIPPFALRAAVQSKEREQIARLEASAKQQQGNVSDNGAGGASSESTIFGMNGFRVHSGSHLVELANAARLPLDHLAGDLQQLLVSFAQPRQADSKSKAVLQETANPRKSQLELTLEYMLQGYISAARAKRLPLPAKNSASMPPKKGA
jgi:hypothetical protein